MWWSRWKLRQSERVLVSGDHQNRSRAYLTVVVLADWAYAAATKGARIMIELRMLLIVLMFCGLIG